MFNRNWILIVFVAALAASAIGAACSGNKARENVLGPALVQQWSGIETEALEGVIVAVAAGDIDVEESSKLELAIEAFGTALRTGDRAAINAADWPIIRGYAEARIANLASSGVIGPGVAETFLERIRTFDEGLTTYLEVPSVPAIVPPSGG